MEVLWEHFIRLRLNCGWGWTMQCRNENNNLSYNLWPTISVILIVSSPSVLFPLDVAKQHLVWVQVTPSVISESSAKLKHFKLLMFLGKRLVWCHWMLLLFLLVISWLYQITCGGGRLVSILEQAQDPLETTMPFFGEPAMLKMRLTYNYTVNMQSRKKTTAVSLC